MSEYKIALINALIKLVPERTGLELQPTIEQILAAHHSALVAELEGLRAKATHVMTGSGSKPSYVWAKDIDAAITKHKEGSDE